MLIEGNSKIYPLLPISIGVLVLSYLLSVLISFLFDLFYDFYLIKFSKIPEKALVQQRLKNEFQRLKTYFKNHKMEQFDEKTAKTRLTIINRLLNERIYSKENSPFADAIAAKLNEKMQKNVDKTQRAEVSIDVNQNIEDNSKEKDQNAKEANQVKV
jgi:hypothetical protein